MEKLKESGETQVSLTDPESRAMMNNQRIEVCYNVQLEVVADKGYYNSVEIKECVDNGITLTK